MRGYIKSFLLICLLCLTGNALAAGAVNDACNSSNPCNSGLYCDLGADRTNKCVKCNSDYPNSDNNAMRASQCYKICENISVTLGTKKTSPENQKIYYSETTPGTCNYRLYCDTNAKPNTDETACVCKENYNINGTSCIGKCYKITLKKNLTNFMETDKDLYVKYDDGFYKNSVCSGTPLTTNDEWLTPSFKWWQDFNGYSTSNETDGTFRFGPDGKPTNGTNATTFTDHTTLYGQWNNNYYIVKYFDGDTQIGGTQQCSLNSAPSDKIPSGTNCPARTESKSNNSGQTIIGWSETKGGTKKYNFNDNIDPKESSQTINLYAVWDECPAGYYCNETEGKRKCPTGATSAKKSTKIGDCYISSATKFKDNGAEFTLPIGQITYKP